MHMNEQSYKCIFINILLTNIIRLIIFKYLLLFELHFITEIEIAISYIFCEKESIDQFTMSINEENRQLFGQVFLLPLIIFPINQATKPLH